MTTTEHLREFLADYALGDDARYGAYLAKEALAFYLIKAAPALLDVVDAAKKYVAYQSDIQSLRDSIAKLDEVKL